MNYCGKIILLYIKIVLLKNTPAITQTFYQPNFGSPISKKRNCRTLSSASLAQSRHSKKVNQIIFFLRQDFINLIHVERLNGKRPRSSQVIWPRTSIMLGRWGHNALKFEKGGKKKLNNYFIYLNISYMKYLRVNIEHKTFYFSYSNPNW